METKVAVKKTIKLLLYSLIVFASMNSVFASENLIAIEKESIHQKIIGLNGFSWYYGFDIELIKQEIVVSIAVNLVPVKGVSMVELSQVKPLWKRETEKIWNNKFAITTKAGDIYPIRIKVNFRGPKFNHSVIVKPGKGRSDQLNWNILDSGQTIAHEVGHMLGAFDEYKRGANAPDNQVIDPTSIMTSNPKTGKSYGRHFKKIQQWFLRKTKAAGSLMRYRVVIEGHGL